MNLRPRTRHPRFAPFVASVALVLAAAVSLTGCVTAGGTSPDQVGAVPLGAGGDTAPSVGETNAAGLGADDGYIAVGSSVSLDDDVPAITNLEPALRDALERAEAAAIADRDLRFSFVDGWRSERYQQYLFEQAVQNYGSEEEAARWVKRGDESKHVTGEAVDLRTADEMDWMNRFGGEFGLCQVYVNEAWHFELTADADGVCPTPLTDGSAG